MSLLGYIGHLFNVWMSIFAAPMKNFEMLWIIIPIYLNWIFTEIYQEKKYTSLGNAISNGTVVLWVGIDWLRRSINLLVAKELVFGFDFTIKILIAFIVLAYGISIILLGGIFPDLFNTIHIICHNFFHSLFC